MCTVNRSCLAGLCGVLFSNLGTLGYNSMHFEAMVERMEGSPANGISQR